MEEGDDGIFEFGFMISVDSVGRKGFLNNRFVNVGGDEKRDIGIKIVVFGEEFIEEDDDERGRNELKDKEKIDICVERGGGIVKIC